MQAHIYSKTCLHFIKEQSCSNLSVDELLKAVVNHGAKSKALFADWVINIFLAAKRTVSIRTSTYCCIPVLNTCKNASLHGSPVRLCITQQAHSEVIMSKSVRNYQVLCTVFPYTCYEDFMSRGNFTSGSVILCSFRTACCLCG